MAETRYEDRTDSFAEKLRLMQDAYKSGHLEVALSLAASIRDTLQYERSTTGDGIPPISDAQSFGRVNDLPAAWARWAKGWEFFKVVTLDETVGEAREQEPIDVVVRFRADQITNLQRELRVARVDAGAGTLAEVPSQLYGEVHRADQASGTFDAHVVFLADAPVHGRATYLLFFGNRYAELPRYATDLTVSGEGYGLDIENQHYKATLSKQVGQLERLMYKVNTGRELYINGDGHGEPPHIDWAHDYLASGGFQKFRVAAWAACPNFEVVKGPLFVQVRRWGFPHGPVHPVFTPSRMHMDMTYTFYASAPYFMKHSSFDMVKDFDITYLRDDEWVLSGITFDRGLWTDKQGKMHEGEVPPEHAEEVWGAGYYQSISREAFMSHRLVHRAEKFDDLHHTAGPTINYHGSVQLWSRWAALDNPHFQAGARLIQKNAYSVIPYPKQGGAELFERERHRLKNPLQPHGGELPRSGKAAAQGTLARYGETRDTAPLKDALWKAMQEVKDGMLYQIDSNAVDLGYVYDLQERNGVVRVLITMPQRGRPKFGFMAQPIRKRLLEVKGVRDCKVDFTWDPPWSAARLSDAGRKSLGLTT